MNEDSILAAWLKICRADTGPGSLVALTGSADPMMVWGDRRLATVVTPIIVAQYVDSTDASGPPWRMQYLFRVGAQAPDGSTDGIVGTILDRLRVVTTHAAFFAEGIDLSVRPRTRRPSDDLVEGTDRKIQDYALTATV